LGGGAGEGEPEVLLEEALLYWLLAARTGHPQACLALGVAFAEGVCGLRADLELGVKLQDLALLLWWQVRARGDEGGGVLLWNTRVLCRQAARRFCNLSWGFFFAWCSAFPHGGHNYFVSFAARSFRRYFEHRGFST
jgi:hypothetical protein